MKTTGAALVRYALEQVGVRHTFGVPGVHNTELYDELHNSKVITPHLVTSEFGGSFAADAISRTSNSIGTLVIVPAAGLTHAASGIAEAYLDGIPMLVITGGIRTDSAFQYQLHDIDQIEAARGYTKGAFRITDRAEAVETIYRAYDLATGGVPGPVLVELPVDIGMQLGDAPKPHPYQAPPAPALPEAVQIDKAAELLAAADNPALYLGWGALPAGKDALVRLAETLEAPVATTMQGLAVFPHDHPLHAGFTFGPAAAPASRNALADHDALLVIGARFSEIGTGSFGIDPPKNIVHIDIDPDVPGTNYPTRIKLVGDSAALVPELLSRLEKQPRRDIKPALRTQIKTDKASWRRDFAATEIPGKINPARFYETVRSQVKDDVITVIDDGNHTFLTAELWDVPGSAQLIGPTDFNAMGYAVPGAVGAKIANPDKQVISFVGDGCFRMTGLELVTLAEMGLGATIFVFNDGELAQISQAQEIPYNQKTCTVLPDVRIHGFAAAVGAEYCSVDSHEKLAETVQYALKTADSGRPVVVDVRMDYSQSTAFTKGIVATNFIRFPLRDKVRIGARAAKRHLIGGK